MSHPFVGVRHRDDEREPADVTAPDPTEEIDMTYGVIALLVALFLALLPVPGGVLWAPLPLGGVVDDLRRWRNGS
jgi:hypothetical protein